MSASIRYLAPELAQAATALVAEAQAAGLQPIVTSTWRTYAEQKKLYDKFLRGESQYPASPPGEGSHEYGWAFDMVVTPRDALWDLGDLWEEWGGDWGGRWRNPDIIHFELPGASQEARRQAAAGIKPHSHGLGKSVILGAIDLVLGLNPAMRAVELAGFLLHLGFPKSEIAAALESPISYLFGDSSP